MVPTSIANYYSGKDSMLIARRIVNVVWNNDLIIDEQLKETYQGLRVLELEISDLAVSRSDEKLEVFKKTIENETRNRIKNLEVIKNQPIFRAYRDFYWKVGIDPTKTRPAGEALTRRIMGGKNLPQINTLVDAYNIASVQTSVAIAAFDNSRIERQSLRMRKARSKETFLGIGMNSPIELSGVEIVIEDETMKELIAVYPYRDAESSKVTEKTKSVLLMMCGVPGIEDTDLIRAKELCESYVAQFCKK